LEKIRQFPDDFASTDFISIQLCTNTAVSDVIPPHCKFGNKSDSESPYLFSLCVIHEKIKWVAYIICSISAQVELGNRNVSGISLNCPIRLVISAADRDFENNLNFGTNHVEINNTDIVFA
jgi:hypothetical protein